MLQDFGQDWQIVHIERFWGLCSDWARLLTNQRNGKKVMGKQESGVYKGRLEEFQTGQLQNPCAVCKVGTLANSSYSV